MDRLERIKIVVEGIEELVKEPESCAKLDRFCTLTGCLVAEAKALLEEKKECREDDAA